MRVTHMMTLHLSDNTHVRHKKDFMRQPDIQTDLEYNVLFFHSPRGEKKYACVTFVAQISLFFFFHLFLNEAIKGGLKISPKDKTSD